MSGMMDCSERRGALGRAQGGSNQQGERQSCWPELAEQEGVQRGSSPQQGCRQAVPSLVLLPTLASNEAYGGLGPIAGVSPAPGMGHGEVGKGHGGLHQVGKGYSQLPEKMGRNRPRQVLTSSGSRVLLENESSWMCLAMPFSSCRGRNTWRR